MEDVTVVKQKQYEGMFVLDANLAGKHWDKAKAQLQEVLENHGAEVIRMEKWEERKLAYEVRKQKRGVYVLGYFKAPPERITRLRRDLGLTEWVLRELILQHRGEVTDENFRKPRARERDREEIRRGSRDSGREVRKDGAEPKAAEPKAAEPKVAEPAAAPAPAADGEAAPEEAKA